MDSTVCPTARRYVGTARRRAPGRVPGSGGAEEMFPGWSGGAFAQTAQRLDALFDTVASRGTRGCVRSAFGGPPVQVGPWTLGRELGRGGMGVVFEAVHAAGARRAVVKVAHRPDADGYAREAAVLRHVAHPSVVRLLDAGALDDGRPYLAMERVEGLTLAQQAGGLPARARLRLFLDVCAAVDGLHRRRVVHADLKPGHVVVSPGGRVVVLDLGSAVRLDAPAGDAEAPRALTPEFAAPEQIVGGPVTCATDVYALGLVLHEILCGRRRRLPWALGGGRGTVFEPFVDETLASAFRRQRRRVKRACIVRTGRRRERLDWRVEAVLNRALQTDAAARYATAATLAQALRAALDPPPDRP